MVMTMTEEETRRLVYAQEDADDASPTSTKKKKKTEKPGKVMMVSLNEIFREREKSRSMSPVISNGSGGNEDVQLDFRGSPSLFHDYHVAGPNNPWSSMVQPDGMKRLGPFRARPFYPEKHVKKHAEMQIQPFQGKPK